LVGIPELGRDKDLFTRQFAVGHGAAHTGFVAIDHGGVDMTVARGQRRFG